MNRDVASLYPAHTRGKVIFRALTLAKGLFKSGAHADLRVRELRRMNGKVNCLVYDTKTGSMHDLIRFCKANRAYFTGSSRRAERRCLEFLDTLLDALLRLQGSSHEPRVQWLNERAVNARLEADLNPMGRGASATPGLCADMQPFYTRVLLDQLFSLPQANLAALAALPG